MTKPDHDPHSEPPRRDARIPGARLPNLALIAERVDSAGQFFGGLSVQDAVLLMVATLSSIAKHCPDKREFWNWAIDLLEVNRDRVDGDFDTDGSA